MASTIEVTGRLNGHLVTAVKRSLQRVPKEERCIAFRINSHGGNTHSMDVLNRFIHMLHHKRKCKIVGQLEYGASAALLFFLNCTERHVAPGSTGIIHLPQPNQNVSPALTAEKREKIIRFIQKRTGGKLTRSDILRLEHQPLGMQEMLDLGIATHKSIDLFATLQTAHGAG